MTTTTQIPGDQWQQYFNRFTRDHLDKEDPSGAATVEVVSPTMGDQFEVSAVRLLGLSYDPGNSAFEVLLDGLEHLIFHPTEIWVLEGEAGLIATIEVLEAHNRKQIIYVRRSGPLAQRYETVIATPDN